MGLFGGKKSPEQQVAEIERLAVTGFGVWGIHGTLVHDPHDRLNSRIVTDSGMQFGLANVILRCLAVPERDWKQVITEHAASISSVAATPAQSHDLDDPQTRRQLRARLLPSGHASQVPLDYALEWAPGVIEVLCLDLPATVATVPHDEIVGRSDLEVLRATGRANLEHESIDERGEIAPGVQYLAGASLFVGSQVLNSAFLDRELGPAPRGIVFSIPDSHLIAFHIVEGSASLAGIQNLVGFTVMHTATDRPGGVLSPEVYYRDPSSAVQQITMIGDDGATGVRVEGAFLEAINT
jgi:hypothetical protein